MKHVAIRTCAGCGRKAPQEELVRFVARSGALAPDRHAPGRGVYTCARLACFERAASRRAFARTLRRTVRVDPALAATFKPVDRSFQTDARARPARSDGGTASSASAGLSAIYTGVSNG